MYSLYRTKFAKGRISNKVIIAYIYIDELAVKHCIVHVLCHKIMKKEIVTLCMSHHEIIEPGI